jgi:Family of unknown function (DUF6228)
VQLQLLSNNGAALLIERDESPNAWWWQVTLSDRDASATTRVDPNGAAPVADFFADLARDWRGWSNARLWEPFERGLRLSATHDGLGHVALRVTLQQDVFPDGWCIEATVKLDAGSLDALARKAASFSGA